MRTRWLAGAALLAGLVAPRGLAIVGLPPEMVGPPRAVLDGRCPVSFGKAGRPAPGVPIPYPALRIGTRVPRTTIPFLTGGGGTSNNGLEAQRVRAGLRPFDPVQGAKPAVYVAGRDQAGIDPVFQRLPIVGAPQGMVFATAASRTEARIAALALTLPSRPAAPPTLRVVGGLRTPDGCIARPVHVFASRMSPAELRGLFDGGECGWIGSCRDRRHAPRGRVLFVQPAGGGGFEHRWIDYDLLAGVR